ncbi:T9SS type A sorting domain-containing protein [Portibacter lacus]|uniref:T9SS type A sorting domain-containing protein n=1 Tax=Portibacter lacus TaxID=1099794 RepID=UPI001F232FB5|nr:T9SS type A sorting domain-containing protein [Portibacter lacus]
MRKILLFCAIICAVQLNAQIVYDYETEGTSLGFKYFASSLDGEPVPTVANPDMTGNASENVLAFTRAANSDTWAGAVSTTELLAPINATAGGKICIDAYFDHIGTLSVKLEGSTTDTDNWNTTVANTKVNEWETLCFDYDANSIEDNMAPAAGNIYNAIVFFPDFLLAAGTEDVITYLDNITYEGSDGSSNVTFRVDANELTVGESGMFLAGDSINNWSADATPMTDEDGDGVWEVTVSLPAGPVRYKFVNSGDFESLADGSSCTVTDGEFTNRFIEVVPGDIVLPIHFFGSCDSPATVMTRVIFDWETPETTTYYKYFGSSIDGDTAHIVANPDPTDVNDSPNVIQLVKPDGAMTWAGAYASPPPSIPIDVVNGGQICADVYFDHIGNIGFKLEASSTEGPIWLNTVENTEINTWQTVCVDVANPGIEDPFEAAAGHIYGQLVLFTDFGVAPEGKNDTSYIDNIIQISPISAGTNDVTFEVNMNNYTDTFTTVYVSGDFNGWSGESNPMTDEDGDGIWITTLALANGPYEYKFTLDNWTSSEQFDGSDVCTKTTINDDGTFTNRFITVSGSTSVGPVCYESCYDCGASVNITWNVNMTNEEVSSEGVYVAGGAYFGHGDLPAMTDPDGDGIYSITIERELGFTTAYTFINGICLPDWNCKEQIAGQDCAVGEFNDRSLDSVFVDTVISTCFGECSTDGTCSDAAEKYMATFIVDMNAETVGENGVFLSGQLINGWSPDATPMTDEDGDGIYTVTVELPSAIVEYKFVNSGAYESFETEGDCNITDPTGEFINRVLLMEEKDTVLVSYIFNSCELTSGVNDLSFNETLFSINPNVSNDFVRINWNNSEDKTISILNVNGQLLSRNAISNHEMERIINVQGMSPGVYFVRVDTPTSFGIKKMIVNR